MPSLLLRLVCLAGLVVAGCGGSSDAPPAPPPPASANVAAADCGLPDFRAEALRLANQARATARMCGSTSQAAAPALAWNEPLQRAAAAHAQDMATRNYFAHESPEGGTLADRLRTAGYAYRAAGENIALGQPSLARVMEDWLGSPSHCENLMSARFREMALACVRNAGNRPVWVMTLGTRG
jgi:uncharacterized protein YkwD